MYRALVICAFVAFNTPKLIDLRTCLKTGRRCLRWINQIQFSAAMSEELQVYDSHGVRFSYPANWELAEDNFPNEHRITIDNGSTSFWSLTLYFERPTPEQLVESASEAFREEYDEIDFYEAQACLCRGRTIARDVDFVCLEFVNSAFLRAFETDEFTALVLYQETNQSLRENRPILEQITNSLEYTGGHVEVENDGEDYFG